MEHIDTSETMLLSNEKRIPIPSMLRDCVKNIEELQVAMDNYLNSNSKLPYLEETREIALSVQELQYGHKSLSMDFSDALETGQNHLVFRNRLKNLESEYDLVKNALQTLIKA